MLKSLPKWGKLFLVYFICKINSVINVVFYVQHLGDMISLKNNKKQCTHFQNTKTHEELRAHFFEILFFVKIVCCTVTVS